MSSIHWKKRLSRGYLLYVILDEATIKSAGCNIFLLADKLSRWGVDFFQFRFQNSSDCETLNCAKKLQKIIQKRKKVLIINNRVDICQLADASGVHLGSSDLPTKEARKILGKNAIIGKTIHFLKELEIFQKEDLDYLSIGPVFKSQLKPQRNPLGKDELKNIIGQANLPFFAIGGINSTNLSSLVAQGVKNIALCRAVILSRNIKKTVLSLKKCLKRV